MIVRCAGRIALTLLLLTPAARAQTGAAMEDTVRLRDLAIVGDGAPRRVMGYGLVVGLEGSGDQSWGASSGALAGGGSPSVRTIMNLLRRFQIDLPAQSLRLRNVAAVMVTGEIPAYAQPGTRFGIQVASIGDATSLAGGTLLMTPLLNEVGGDPVATAQGPLPLPPEEGRRAVRYGRGRLGATRLALGDAGQVTVSLGDPLGGAPQIPIRLRTPDPLTALAIERRLREWAGDTAAAMVDPGVVQFMPPDNDPAGRIRWAATADTLSVELPRTTPRILWDARGRVLVAGEGIPVRAGAVQTGGVAAEVRPDSLGRPQTVGGLVRALQAAGATGEDIGRLLQGLAQAGHLRATVVVQ